MMLVYLVLMIADSMIMLTLLALQKNQALANYFDISRLAVVTWFVYWYYGYIVSGSFTDTQQAMVMMGLIIGYCIFCAATAWSAMKISKGMSITLIIGSMLASIGVVVVSRFI